MRGTAADALSAGSTFAVVYERNAVCYDNRLFGAYFFAFTAFNTGGFALFHEDCFIGVAVGAQRNGSFSGDRYGR